MGGAKTPNWTKEFERAAALSDIRRRRLAERFREEHDRQRQDHKKRADEARDWTDDLLVQAVVLATQEQIAAMRAQLDAYDAAVTAALMENAEDLDAARADVDDMLDRAHRLPDGRRVFRSEDGERVFDEFGNDVTDQISPDEIDPSRPTWTEFAAGLERQRILEQQRTDLLAFQAQVDEARRRLDSGTLTQQDLDRMRADLEADMPEAVRRQLAPEAPDQAPPETTATPAQPLDLDAMRRDLAANRPDM